MSKVKLSVEAYHHNNYQYEVECMEGNEPVDRVVTEDALYEWLFKTNYCTRGYHDQMGEWVEMPADVDTYMQDADLYKILADYLNDTEGRTLPTPRQPKPLPKGALLPNLAGQAFMAGIPRPKTAA